MLIPLLLTPSAWSEPFTSAEIEVLGAIREADLGVERAYVNESEYTLVPPADLAMPLEITDGSSTWTYIGQQVFTDRPEPVVGSEWAVPDVVVGYEGDPDGYFGVGEAERVDAYGRRWLLTYVDHDELGRMVEDYEADVRAQFGAKGRPASARAKPPAFEYPPNAGEKMWLEPMTWDVTTCSDGVIADYLVDPLSTMPAPSNDIARKVLWLASSSCSGTMVDDKWLLTAAHCVTDGAGVPKNPNTEIWCTMENLDENVQPGYTPTCWAADLITPSPWWTTCCDAVNDYAVVKLTNASVGVGWMALTSQPDSTVDNYGDFVRGYKRKNHNCTDATVSASPGGPTTNELWDGRHLVGASGTIASMHPGYVYYLTSNANGMSGGPHYYCPNGACLNGHWMSGVNAYVNFSSCIGNLCALGYSSGPKALSIYNWVVGATP